MWPHFAAGFCPEPSVLTFSLLCYIDFYGSFSLKKYSSCLRPRLQFLVKVLLIGQHTWAETIICAWNFIQCVFNETYQVVTLQIVLHWFFRQTNRLTVVPALIYLQLQTVFQNDFLPSHCLQVTKHMTLSPYFYLRYFSFQSTCSYIHTNASYILF